MPMHKLHTPRHNKIRIKSLGSRLLKGRFSREWIPVLGGVGNGKYGSKNSMSRYFAEIRVPPFTKGKKETEKFICLFLKPTVCTTLLGELGVSLLMLNRYLYICNTDCPKTPISWPKEKRGETRATVPLTSSNYSEGPTSTQVLLCDGPLNQVPILQV